MTTPKTTDSGALAPASCSACRHCGPAIGDNIRCQHPFWNEIGEPKDSDMRELHPSFAEECEDYELPNDKGDQRCQAVGGNAEGKVPTTAPDDKQECPGGQGAAGADRVIKAAREHYSAMMILTGGDASEDDQYRAVAASEALHAALKAYDAQNSQLNEPSA